jgi:hypothetical protein
MRKADDSHSRRNLILAGGLVAGATILPFAASSAIGGDPFDRAGLAAIAGAAAGEDPTRAALYARFEPLCLAYLDESFRWAARARARKADLERVTGTSEWPANYEANCARGRLLEEISARMGYNKLDEKWSALHYVVEPMVEAIIEVDDSSPAALRAKMLAVLFEYRLCSADDDEQLMNAADDGGAVRSLVRAVAGAVGFAKTLAAYESRFPAPVGGDDDEA